MSTYLELTNQLLRRVNEVELTASTFPSSYGVQSMAKDAIQASINEIMTASNRWPFNYRVMSQLLTIGQENYAIPNNYEYMDWYSFRIRKDDTLNVNTTNVTLMNRDELHQKLLPADLDAGVTGRGVPAFIAPDSADVPNAGGDYRGYTISPSPDKAYTLDFQAYEIINELSTYSQACRIPDRFNYVIMAGALKHFYMFRDNTEQAVAQQPLFNKALAQMIVVLVPVQDDLVDTRTNFGGMTWRTQAYRPGGRY